MVPAFSGCLSQPCVWLKGKIKAQQNFKHEILPQIFGESHQTLQAFWPPKTMCHQVIFVCIYKCFPDKILKVTNLASMNSTVNLFCVRSMVITNRIRGKQLWTARSIGEVDIHSSQHDHQTKEIDRLPESRQTCTLCCSLNEQPHLLQDMEESNNLSFLAQPQT